MTGDHNFSFYIARVLLERVKVARKTFQGEKEARTVYFDVLSVPINKIELVWVKQGGPKSYTSNPFLSVCSCTPDGSVGWSIGFECGANPSSTPGFESPHKVPIRTLGEHGRSSL